MSSHLECPRCNSALAVPGNRAGGQVRCAKCGGRFRVSGGSARAAAGPSEGRGAPEADREAAPAAGAAAPAASGARRNRNGDGKNTAPPTAATGSPSPAPEAPVARRVARFIPVEPVRSTFVLAEQGKLPEMRLDEGRRASARDHRPAGMSPLALFVLLCLSGVASLALVLMPGDAARDAKVKKRDQARQAIQQEYFRDKDSPEPRHAYQRLLRLAQQAHDRGEARQERRLYREVLDLLRSERGRFDRGVTGSQQRDRTLETHVFTILSD